MENMGANYSLSDMAAVSGNGFGGGNAWIMILLFAMIFGNGGGWFGNRGNGDYGQYATAASQQEILFGQRFQGLDNKLDGLGNGISDATYALNNTIVNEGRQGQAAVGQVRFDIANYQSAIKEAIHAEGEATRGMLQQNKIETLQGQVSQLQLQQALCGVVRYPNAMTYSAGGSPFCNYNGGCGCGNV